MPKSKHRRKPGGKSENRPGRIDPERGPSSKSTEAAVFAMMTVMSVMVTERTDETISLRQRALTRVHKTDLFERFLRSGSRNDRFVRTVATAESALALLLKAETFVLDGDMVSVSPRVAEPLEDDVTGAVGMLGNAATPSFSFQSRLSFSGPARKA